MRRRVGLYGPEFGLVASVALIVILGFWDIYFGANANAQPHHHLHIATVFVWMALLLTQLSLVASHRFRTHRNVGLAVLIAGPLLVATTAMLSVHSAHRAVMSGEADFLIVQNVMVTVELGMLIFLAFLLKSNRKLHGSMLMSTTIMFMGIGLFFAMMSFVPAFRIEGPETFYRFQMAAMTAQLICLFVGFLFLLRDWRNNWPFFMAGAFFFLNEAIRSQLASAGLIDPLTALVGSMSQPMTFIATFTVFFLLLAGTTLPAQRRPRAV